VRFLARHVALYLVSKAADMFEGDGAGPHVPKDARYVNPSTFPFLTGSRGFGCPFRGSAIALERLGKRAYGRRVGNMGFAFAVALWPNQRALHSSAIRHASGTSEPHATELKPASRMAAVGCQKRLTVC
jgi:hypothetical protein